MPDVVIDNRAAEITEHLRSTLAALTKNGEPFFSKVSISDDPESFFRVADPLQGTKAVAAVVAGSVELNTGADNSESDVCRLPFEVLVRFYRGRLVGETEGAATADMQMFASVVRTALLSDRSRGGRTNLITYNGAVLNGTDVRGASRPLLRDPEGSFYVVGVPGACGWSIFGV